MMKTDLAINPDLGILLLRIFIAGRIIYGVVDNIFSWEKMLEFSVFLEAFEFPLPIYSAILSVYLQFISAILILLGYYFRIGAAILIINFLIALLFVHFPLQDRLEEMTPALAIFFCSLTFFLTGPGKFSLDHILVEMRRKKIPVKS